VRRLTAESGLPPELQTVVRTTVRATRLRMREKLDVARELIAHFRDGLEAGQNADALLRSFGDVALAARLIRRARIRQRSAFYRATAATIRYGLLFAATSYALLSVRYYWGEVRLTRNYVREFNAPILAIPEADRAWPTYRRAYLAAGKWPTERWVESEGPSSPDWERLGGYLAANNESLRLYREAAAKPALGAVLSTATDEELSRHLEDPVSRNAPIHAVEESENPPFVAVLLPYLRPLRFGSRMLRIDTLLAAEQGDGPRVVENVLAMLAMADHCAEPPLLICDLASNAMVSLAALTIGEVVARRPAVGADAGWVRISHRLAGVRGGGALQMRLDGERANFEDYVQRTYTDNESGDGHLRLDAESIFQRLVEIADSPNVLRPSMLLAPIISAATASRRDLIRKYDEMLGLVEQESARPLWHRDVSALERETERLTGSSIENSRYLFVGMLFPSLSRAGYLFEVATQERDAALVAIALELYRRAHGAYPPALDALVPRYLPAVPPDRYDGKPLKYRLVNGRPLLYSVGVNRVDDGGVLPKAETPAKANVVAREWIPPSQLPTTTTEKKRIRGDWILWPPVDIE